MATSSESSGNPILDHPGFSATIFAILVFCTFVGAIYNSATSHHEEGGASHGASGEHGAEHKASHAEH